jgi:hypothetical protein
LTPDNSPDPSAPSANGAPPAADPFDPASLRLNDDWADAIGVKRVILSIPHRKPDKSWWIRAHPSADYRLQTAVIELREERELYLVAPSLLPDLVGESTLRPKLLVTAINRQGVLFLWEVNLPQGDGRVDDWTRTMLEAVNMATTQWVRVQANMHLGAYDVAYTDKPPEPKWPEMSFRDILRTSFKDLRIDSLDHPVLRQLRGEA